MWYKHSVWCQCVLSIPILLSLSTIASTQTITFDMDIFWSFIFLISTTIQFIEAEHGFLFKPPDFWKKINDIRTNIILYIILIWSFTQWSMKYYLYSLVITGIISFITQTYHKNIYTLAALVPVIFIMPYYTIFIFMYGTCLYLKDYYFKKSVGTSIADMPIRFAYANKAMAILFESIILWSIRCNHRFPHTFRWKPFITGLFVFTLSFFWCKYNIKETKVSRNAIIHDIGHGMAASLTAAQKCNICKKCLTALDMESSFGE